MGSATRPDPATIDDFLSGDPSDRLELICGTLVEKPLASSDHSLAQGSMSMRIGDHFQRRPGGRHPGGWWLFTELPVLLGKDAVRPDLCGYRRERMPEPPKVPLVKLAPDWICELLSPSNEARDRVEKLQIYFRAGVPHYWIMNSDEGTLEVFRRTELAYALVLTARRGDRVRAEPFEAVELSIDELLGADPPEDAPRARKPRKG